MPKKAKPAPKKPQTKAEFILTLPTDMPAKEAVTKAATAGFTLNKQRVHNIRWAAKQKGKAKKAKVVRAAVKPKPGKVRRAAPPAGRRPAPPRAATPARASTHTIADLDPLDLAYAVGRLVEAGKTTAAEVAKLATERSARIIWLETELAALKGGQVPAAEVAKRVKAPKARKAAEKTATRAKKPKSKATKGTKGTVLTFRDGRKFTMTPKALAARRFQGTYLNYLRQVPDKEKAKFKGIAKDKGVGVAVDELKKRLGKK